MNSKTPIVSFVIPTHNRANVIRDCLESVVNQTYRNIEIVVVNDNSTDHTLKILEEYQNKYNFSVF
ncbi:MAG: glycosyltransferase family 2 protein [Sphingobacteriaceae bacterium]|nr:glycosyltransferase family 2 protein [Sphingobacteriaceae bacterium]